MHSPRLFLTTVLSVTALVAGGCGSSNSPKTTKSTSAPRPATKTTGAVQSTRGLTGKWSGQYSGAYSGTFNLNWSQTGSNLSGKITLSSPAETTGISGSVSGSSIKFGAVGGAAYTGTVSGNSMSGSYVTGRGGGSWNATKG